MPFGTGVCGRERRFGRRAITRHLSGTLRRLSRVRTSGRRVVSGEAEPRRCRRRCVRRPSRWRSKLVTLGYDSRGHPNPVPTITADGVSQVFANFLLFFSASACGCGLAAREHAEADGGVGVLHDLLTSAGLDGPLDARCLSDRLDHDDRPHPVFLQVSSLGFCSAALTRCSASPSDEEPAGPPSSSGSCPPFLLGVFLLVIVLCYLDFRGVGRCNSLARIERGEADLLRLLAAVILRLSRFLSSGIVSCSAMCLSRTLEYTAWVAYNAPMSSIIRLLEPTELGAHTVSNELRVHSSDKIAPILNANGLSLPPSRWCRAARTRLASWAERWRMMSTLSVGRFSSASARRRPKIVDLVFGPNGWTTNPILGLVCSGLPRSARSGWLLPAYLQGIGDSPGWPSVARWRRGDKFRPPSVRVRLCGSHGGLLCLVRCLLPCLFSARPDRPSAFPRASKCGPFCSSLRCPRISPSGCRSCILTELLFSCSGLPAAHPEYRRSFSLSLVAAGRRSMARTSAPGLGEGMNGGENGGDGWILSAGSSRDWLLLVQAAAARGGGADPRSLFGPWATNRAGELGLVPLWRCERASGNRMRDRRFHLSRGVRQHLRRVCHRLFEFTLVTLKRQYGGLSPTFRCWAGLSRAKAANISIRTIRWKNSWVPICCYNLFSTLARGNIVILCHQDILLLRMRAALRDNCRA